MSKRKHFANWQSLLETWSPEKAWFLGLMWGDGNVYRSKVPHRSSYRVGIVGSLSTTTRVAAILQLAKEPRRISENGYEIFVRDKGLLEWFERTYSMSGPKAHKLVWPSDLPARFDRDFLRGLWDSDGSLSIERRKHKGNKGNDSPQAGYSSICQPFVFAIRDRLEQYFSVPRVTVTEPSDTDACYRVNYGGSSAMLIAHGIYRGAPPHISNEDRLEIYSTMSELEESVLTARCGNCGAGGHLMQDLCHPCWHNRKGRTTGEGTKCASPGCPRESSALKLCAAHYSKLVRSDPNWKRKPTGTCNCGQPAFRKEMCDKCYHHSRKQVKS